MVFADSRAIAEPDVDIDNIFVDFDVDVDLDVKECCCWVKEEVRGNSSGKEGRNWKVVWFKHP